MRLAIDWAARMAEQATEGVTYRLRNRQGLQINVDTGAARVRLHELDEFGDEGNPYAGRRQHGGEVRVGSGRPHPHVQVDVRVGLLPIAKGRQTTWAKGKRRTSGAV